MWNSPTWIQNNAKLLVYKRQSAWRRTWSETVSIIQTYLIPGSRKAAPPQISTRSLTCSNT